MIPDSGAVLHRAARLAQRLLCRHAVARCPGVSAQGRVAECCGQGAGRRRGRRRRPLARCRHGDRRAHAARGRPAADAQAVRRHGAAGLRPMRLPVRNLLGGHRRRRRDEAQPVRSWRQRNEPHAEAAARGGAGGAHSSRARRSGPTGKGLACIRQLADAPVEAVFRSAARLNGPDSEKDTRHVVLDISGCGLDYVPGDSFGLFPTNDPALADAVLAAMRAPPDFPVGGKTFRQALIEDYALAPAPDMLFELIGFLAGGERRKKARLLAKGGDPDGDAATFDVLAALETFGPDPPRSGSVPRMPRAAAAAALFDRLLAAGDARRGPPDRRRRALSHRRAHPARRRLDVSRRSAFGGCAREGLPAERARLRPPR